MLIDTTMVIRAYKNLQQLILLFFAGVMINSCIEPFEPKTPVFENDLVIEATITNEFKQHEIILSRTSRLEDLGLNIIAEKNADVRIIDENQNEIQFQENSPGHYISTVEFSALANISYELQITTQDGKNYASKPAKSPELAAIFELKADRIIDSNGDEGIEINVSYDPNEGSKYYRYEYEETYKIKAPKWVDSFLIFTASDIIIQPKIGLTGLYCYNTDVSKNTIINSTVETNNIETVLFPVRFINRNNYIISHRYSILVKQYVISKEAHQYLETVRSLEDQEDIFSPTQPGFFKGNVFSLDNFNEKVLGYFDITSVTTERIYFNYADLFPDEPLPPYLEDCNPIVPFPVNLKDTINSGLVTYFSTDAFGNHSVVDRVCGDCTVIGNSTPPEFWIE